MFGHNTAVYSNLNAKGLKGVEHEGPNPIQLSSVNAAVMQSKVKRTNSLWGRPLWLFLPLQDAMHATLTLAAKALESLIGLGP